MGGRHAAGSPISSAVGRFTQELVWTTGVALYRRWFGLRVHGLHNLPSRGPYLLVSNHGSHLDGPAIMAARGGHYRRVFALGARDYFFRGSVQTWISTYVLNMVPIDRNRPDFGAINRCREIAGEGGIILMFPEGTRSVTGQIQPFKLGLGLIAQKLDIPIVPVFVGGTVEALPKGRSFPRRRPIHVVFGEPIDVAPPQERGEAHRLSYRQTAEQVFRAVLELRDTLQGTIAGGKGDTEWGNPLPQYL